MTDWRNVVTRLLLTLLGLAVVGGSACGGDSGSATGDAEAPVDAGEAPTTVEYLPNEDGTTDSLAGSYNELTDEVDSAEAVCFELGMGALLDDVFVSVMDTLSLSPDEARAFVIDAIASECASYEQHLPQMTGAADEWNRL